MINVLQDALLNERSLTKVDINKLILAQQVARDGSMDALSSQYDRMLLDRRPSESNRLSEAIQSRQRRIGAAEEPQYPVRRQLTLPAAPRSNSPEPLRRVRTLPVPLPRGLCRYSEDLQMTRKSLGPSFDATASHRCPACGLLIRVSADDTWVLEARTPVTVSDSYGGEQQVIEARTFEVGARFVVKCHTEDGEFACVLCPQYRDVDAICGNVESLVRHLGQVHTSAQFEREVDLVSV